MGNTCHFLTRETFLEFNTHNRDTRNRPALNAIWNFTLVFFWNFTDTIVLLFFLKFHRHNRGTNCQRTQNILHCSVNKKTMKTRVIFQNVEFLNFTHNRDAKKSKNAIWNLILFLLSHCYFFWNFTDTIVKQNIDEHQTLFGILHCYKLL